MDELFGNIENFGELVLLIQNTNYNAQPGLTNQTPNVHPNNNVQQSNQVNNRNPINNHQNETNHSSGTPQQPDYRRKRPTWNRNNRDIDFVNNNATTESIENTTLPLPSNRNTTQSSTNNNLTSRSIFGPNPFTNENNGSSRNQGNRNVERQAANTNEANQRNQSNPPRPRSRPIFGGSGASTARSAENSFTNRRQRSPPRSPVSTNTNRRPRLLRSDTFEIENPTNGAVVRVRPSQTLNDNMENSELYNVRRRQRAKTPVTFAVMLDEPESNLNFDVPTNNSILTETLLNNPTVDYASKRRAKQIIGKQGREQGEFVWPIGTAINPIGKHIIVADSSNHRVQIFESNGTFVKSIGSQGDRDNQFDCVSDVAVDAMANLYVVDRHNHRIQIFDRYCRFVRSTGSGPGNFLIKQKI